MGYSLIHNQLVYFAKTKLIREGYKNIQEEKGFPNKKKIDLFATKNGKTIGIECLTSCNFKTKVNFYSKYVDKLVFCIPEKVWNYKRKEEIWSVPHSYFENGIMRSGKS